MNWRRIHEIVHKELVQTLREPRMRFLLFGPPVIQLVLFGFAVNLDVRNARIAWVDQDDTPASRELRAAFEGSDYFRIVAHPGREGDLKALLDTGAVVAVVRVPPGFSADIKRGRTAPVQVLVDGSNSNTAAIVASYAGRVVGDHAGKLLVEQQRSLLVRRSPIDPAPVRLSMPGVRAQTRVWFNPELYSRYYFVPGVVVNILALVTIILTAMSIVREKEIGTMEQLMVTPIRPLELMIGKLLPFGLIGIVEVGLVTGAALLIFQIPLRGNPVVLFGASTVFLLTTLGLGLFISTISHTQQQAVMSSFFFLMPALMLSGFAIPINNMPLPVQWLTYLNPLRYFMEVVRGIFLKGTGLEGLWSQLLILLIYGATVLGLSALRFHKRLD
jgi:ABC-2 type transport system permease protein